jgi:hypothetical protein
MAKMTKKNKSASSAKRGKAKTMGDEPFDVDTPPPPRSTRLCQLGVEVLLNDQQEGIHRQPLVKGAKNYIDVVFHNGGVPAKSKEPNITLDERGKALRVEWKLPEKLYTPMQATAQLIPVDSARYSGYCNTQDQMKAAGVHPVEGCYRSILQVVTLKHECTGIPETLRFDVPTNNHVHFENGWHRQFNSMYVSTLQVAKDRHTLVTGPKSMGIANFGDMEPVRGGYNWFSSGGGGSGYSKSGRTYPPPGRVSNSMTPSSNDDDDE